MEVSIMKTCRLLTFAAPLLASVLISRQTQAQFQPYYSQPSVSPYINLLRAGSPAGVNYYGIVRPEVNFRNSIQQLQTQSLAQQQTLLGMQTPPGVLTTGHPVGFMTHLGYFQNLGAPGGSTAFNSGVGPQARPGGGTTNVPAPRRGR
jgi:hypothetical protein